MNIKFLRPVVGFAYFEGDITGSLPDDRAAYLVSIGAAVLIPETEGKTNTLPDDLPARQLLFDAGFETVADILNAQSTLTDVPGISKRMAEKILKALTSIQQPASRIQNPESSIQ